MSKRFVAVDIGTSETRVAVDGGNALRVPNNCVILDAPTDASFPAGEGILGAIEATVEGFGDGTVHLLYGEMASRYAVSNQRPSPLAAKHTQTLNQLAVIVGAALARIEQENNLPSELYIALPPIEVRKARTELQEALSGDYKVTLPKLNRVVRVKFDKVTCMEESRMAGVAFLPQLTPEQIEGSFLSIDIGAGTTDLAIFTGGTFYERSATTYKLGGHTLREYVIDEILSEYEFELSQADAEKVIADGKLKVGARFIDVTKSVNIAKHEFAKKLVERIVQYFKKVDVNIQSISTFAVSGGGSMAGGEEARSLVSYVVDELKAVCPDVDVVEYAGDPRLANLDGLNLTAKQNLAVGRKVPVEMAKAAVKEKAVETAVKEKVDDPAVGVDTTEEG
jgi:hypothetical protein